MRIDPIRETPMTSAPTSCIRWFRELSLSDLPLVGGKNASLGEKIGRAHV